MKAIIRADRLPSIGSGFVIPVGQIEYWTGPTVPGGWLECDGRSYARKAFPELAGICRQFTPWWRWHIARRFNVPHLRGQAMMPARWLTSPPK